MSQSAAVRIPLFLPRKDGLPDNIIYSLAEDHDGNIWMGSVDCIVKYDGIKFTPYYEDSIPNFKG